MNTRAPSRPSTRAGLGLALLLPLVAAGAAQAQPAFDPTALLGTWDAAGENHTGCEVERPAGTLTVERGNAPGLFRIRQELRWEIRAKPGCPAPGSAGATDAASGLMRVEGDIAILATRRPDGSPHGAWTYRLKGDRLHWVPGPDDGMVATSFAWVRRP